MSKAGSYDLEAGLPLRQLNDSAGSLAVESPKSAYGSQDAPLKRPRVSWQSIAAVFTLALLCLALAVHYAFRLGRTDAGDEGSGNSNTNDKLKLKGPTVILISVDGARPEYFTRQLTPTFDWMAKEGVRADYMLSQFPTKTFPNHYSIATGLYPESHGIVDNAFWDPQFAEMFDYHSNVSTTDGKWWGGEPIWVTASRHNLTSAMCFFPGTEASIGGRRPDIWLPYSKAASLVTNDRVDLVLSWLNTTNDAQRPRMLGIYFSIVDSVGHGFGPRSPQVDNALAEVDAGMARLFAGLAALGIDDQVNVVVVSDHGMTENSEERVADLSQIIDPSRVTYSGGSPVIQVYPHDPADTAAIFEGLYAARDSHHMTILLKEQLPPHLHYLNNGRIAPIIAIADFQYALWTSDLDRYVIKGQHGYDANEPDMHAIFYAHGPAFKKGKDMTANSTIPFTLPAFQNIEVYNVLARALGVDPAPNNGTLPVLPSIAQAMTV